MSANPLDAALTPWNHSTEAEQSVLGSILMDNGAFDRVADILRAEHFYIGAHASTFQAIEKNLSSARPADLLTVAETLGSWGKLEESGGRKYLSDIVVNTPSAANVRRYAEIVRERWVARRLYAASTETCEALRASRDVREVLDEAQARVLKLGEGARGGQSDFRTADSVIREVTDFVDLQHARYKEGKIKEVIGVPTGFADLDRTTTGLQPGDLILLAARPAMGKSALSLNIAEHAAGATGKFVQFYTLEMSARQMGLRLLASGSRVHTQRLITGRLSEQEWPKVADAAGVLRDLKIAFCQVPGATIGEIRSFSRRAVREFGPPCLLVVDYLQLMLAGETETNRSIQLAEITRGLKLLAQELDVPVLALSQLNREVEKRHNKRPVMSDLRDSGALEQDADIILFIYRDEVYNKDSADTGTAEIIIAKQRNGPIGMERLTFRGDFTRFDNYARIG